MMDKKHWVAGWLNQTKQQVVGWADSYCDGANKFRSWKMDSLDRATEVISSFKKKDYKAYLQGKGRCCPSIQDACVFKLFGFQKNEKSSEITMLDNDFDDCWLVYLVTENLTEKRGKELYGWQYDWQYHRFEYFLETIKTNKIDAQKCYDVICRDNNNSNIFSFRHAHLVLPEIIYGELSTDNPLISQFDNDCHSILLEYNRDVNNKEEIRKLKKEKKDKDKLISLMAQYGHPDTWKG